MSLNIMGKDGERHIIANYTAMFDQCGESSEATMTQKAITDAINTKADQETVDQLTEVVNNISLSSGGGTEGTGSSAKLYESTGQNTDGAMTQKAVTDILGDVSTFLDGINGIADTTIQNVDEVGY